MSLVAGIDPGTKTGLALVETENGKLARVVGTWTMRLLDFQDDLGRWLVDHGPELFAYETAQYTARTGNRHSATVRAGYNVGYVHATLNSMGLRSWGVSPTRWRQACGVRHTAPKFQAHEWLANTVAGFDLATNAHTRDAIGIAVAGIGFLLERPMTRA